MVGRSNVVGLPVSLLMMAEDATVTVTHEKTIDLGAYTRQGEVVVVATGVPGLITGDMLKPGAVVIDVGTTYVDGKLRGDVDWESASQVASAITPVPGGVGPVTNVALMRNVMHAAESLSATP
jgi:methylenetetrahydrofolate dehydrogenase (NADP+)/methenyltetrahydrofolate cyclohydrolase